MGQLPRSATLARYSRPLNALAETSRRSFGSLPAHSKKKNEKNRVTTGRPVQLSTPLGHKALTPKLFPYTGDKVHIHHYSTQRLQHYDTSTHARYRWVWLGVVTALTAGLAHAHLAKGQVEGADDAPPARVPSLEAVKSLVEDSEVMKRLKADGYVWVQRKDGDVNDRVAFFDCISFNKRNPRDPQTHVLVGYLRYEEGPLIAEFLCDGAEDNMAVAGCLSEWFRGGANVDSVLRGSHLPSDLETELLVISMTPAILVSDRLKPRMYELFQETGSVYGGGITPDQLCKSFYVRYRAWDDTLGRLVDIEHNLILSTCDMPAGWPLKELLTGKPPDDTLDDLTLK